MGKLTFASKPAMSMAEINNKHYQKQEIKNDNNKDSKNFQGRNSP